MVPCRFLVVLHASRPVALTASPQLQAGCWCLFVRCLWNTEPYVLFTGGASLDRL